MRADEALDFVPNAAESDGWEARRVLTRRFQPQQSGRRRNVMSQFLQRSSFDRTELNSAITKWEDLQCGSPGIIKSSILTEMTMAR